MSEEQKLDEQRNNIGKVKSEIYQLIDVLYTEEINKLRELKKALFTEIQIATLLDDSVSWGSSEISLQSAINRLQDYSINAKEIGSYRNGARHSMDSAGIDIEKLESLRDELKDRIIK